MNLSNLSMMEKIEMAIETTEYTLLEMLLLSPNMLVRRAMLRNANVTSAMVNKLAQDVVENVSYLASKHHKCTIVRKFTEPVNVCVKCKVDERKLPCEDCTLV